MTTSLNPMISSSIGKPFDDTMSGKLEAPGHHTYQECTVMPIDLVERFDRYILVAEMPGFTDVETYFVDGYFHLSGNKQDLHDRVVEDHFHLHLERPSGRVRLLEVLTTI